MEFNFLCQEVQVCSVVKKSRKSVKHFIAIILSAITVLSSYAQTWNNASVNNLWYDAANWTPNTGPAGWTSTSSALFTDAGTRSVGIDFSQGDLAINNLNISAPGITTGGTVAIGNNSSINGSLNIYGGLFSFASTSLSIENNVSGNSGNLTMQIMGSSLTITPYAGTIRINTAIAGVNKPVNATTSLGIGGAIEFAGANTYTGLTTISGGGGSSSMYLTLKRPGGGTLPATNDIYVSLNGRLVVETNQTLHDLTMIGNGTLQLNNATLTITGKLKMPPGNVSVIGSGKIVYAPGATLEYGSGYTLTSTTDAEFPVVDGPTNVITNVSIPTFSLHANRVITGALTATNPFVLGNNNFTGSSATGVVVTNGTGKLYITNVGAGPVSFPVSIGALASVPNPVIISNGQGLTYGVRVAVGHTPALGVSNDAVNRTWYIEPSAATGTTPVNVSFAYANTHGNAGFNYTNPVDVLKYKATASQWVVQQANITQTQPIAASAYSLTSGTETPFTIANGGAVPSTIVWNNASTNNEWYDPANWIPNMLPEAWTEACVADFVNAGPRTVGIDFSQGNLTIAGIRNSGGTVTIGNSSTTPGVVNIHQFIRAIGTQLVLQNNNVGTGKIMDIELANTISVSPTLSSITIECNVKGIGKGINVGSGGLLILSGQNTYTGITTLTGGGGSLSSQLRLSHPSGGTLPNTNVIIGADQGNVNIGTDQILDSIELSPNSNLGISSGATLTITKLLQLANSRATTSGSGKIVYAPGATLKYSSLLTNLGATAVEFPATDGPTNVEVTTQSIQSAFPIPGNRTVTGTLTGFFTLGNFNLTAATVTHPGSIIVTNGSGKLFIDNVGASPVTFPIWVGGNPVPFPISPNHVTISNGQNLTYGVRVAVGHTPSLILSNNAVNRTWYVEPSATPALGPQAPVNISFSYDNAHVNAGFNLTNPVDVLQYNNGAGNWQVGHFNIPQPQPVAAAITGLTGSTELPLTIINTGLALAASDIILQCTRQSNGYGYINWDLKMDISTVKELQLEKSADGRHFTKISSYPAANANHIDADLFSGKNYYRLKVIYNNDKFEYSAIAAIINSATGFDIVNLMPNIVNTTAQLNITSAKKTKLNITITDMAGRSVYKQLYNAAAGSSLYTVNVSLLAAGMYNLTAVTATGEVKTVKFIKQ